MGPSSKRKESDYVKCFTFGVGGVYKDAIEAGEASKEFYKKDYLEGGDDREKTEEARTVVRAYGDARRKMEKLIESRGARYAECRFDNYEIHAKKNAKLQQEAVERLKQYAADSVDAIRKGKNVVLIGPKGNGKDHLGMALAKLVFRHSLVPTTWINGCVLSKQFHLSSTKLEPVEVADKPPEILWISDPVVPSGVIRDFQNASMLALVDERYNNLRPTWITANFSDKAEGAERMGAQTFDRLCHDALVIQTNWESYRQL